MPWTAQRAVWLVASIYACSTVLPSAATETDGTGIRVLLDVGHNVGERVARGVRSHLAPWLSKESELAAHDVVKTLLSGKSKSGSPLTIVVSLGNTSIFASLLEEAWAKPPAGPSQGYEGYGVLNLRRGSLAVVAANGRAMDPHWGALTTVDTGAAFAAYDMLQELGFDFWHPLQPMAPASLRLPAEGGEARWEGPRWRSRAFHLHTQHPLELTDVLQGFDIPLTMTIERGRHAWDALAQAEAGAARGSEGEGEGEQGGGGRGPACGSVVRNGTYCEYWEDMLGHVDRFFEWCVAQRVNRVEWILLGSRKWGPITEGALRHRRLAHLARMGQAWGLMVGVDVPIALQQQHSWVMTTTLGPIASQLAAVRGRVDWVLSAGFDFMSTESGLSEFTSPDDTLMLRLLDAFATRVNVTWHREATVKVHCSPSQVCKSFVDPRTGQPLNFNFLPTYAHPSLGVLPHTVQAYALDDPTANVYGNANFSAMRDYAMWEAKQGNRSVHFYPETAYWVNVDVDVPLFLPLYGQRRLHDLLLLAQDEDAMGTQLAGVLNFDSGWEWGYWLNDVILAAAAWDPRQFQPSSTNEGEDGSGPIGVSSSGGGSEFERALERVFRNVQQGHLRRRLVAWLTDVAREQHELLILGRVPGAPALGEGAVGNNKLSGIAYLCGTDTWVDLPRRLGLAFTQPDKVRFSEFDDPCYPRVFPLLTAMRDSFAQLHEEGDSIVQDFEREGEGVLGGPLLEHVGELRDGMAMVALRARQVWLLYEASRQDVSGEEREALLAQARAVLHTAQEVVSRRESLYRAPMGRMGGWREGPTVYGFGYLWTVHSLYYWWRDQGLVEGRTPKSRWSPCYLNRIDPTEVVIGLGKQALHRWRDTVVGQLPFDSFIADCLAPPKREFVFPRDL